MTSISKKLTFAKETLRLLAPGEMKEARGGEVYQTIVRPSDACGTPTGG